MDTATMAIIGDLTWDGAFVDITALGIAHLAITAITVVDTVYTDTDMAAGMDMVTVITTTVMAMA